MPLELDPSSNNNNARKVQGIPLFQLPLDGKVFQATQLFQVMESASISGARLTQQISAINGIRSFERQSYAVGVYQSTTEMVLEFVDSTDTSYDLRVKNRFTFMSRFNFLEGGRFQIKAETAEQQKGVESHLAQKKNVVVRHKGNDLELDGSQVEVGVMTPEDLRWLADTLSKLHNEQPEGQKTSEDIDTYESRSNQNVQTQHAQNRVDFGFIFGSKHVVRALEVAYCFAVEMGRLIRRQVEKMEEAADREAALILLDAIRSTIAKEELNRYELNLEANKNRLVMVNLYNDLKEPFLLRESEA